MKTILILSYLILLGVSLVSLENRDLTINQLETILLKYVLKQDDKIMIMFYNPGECPSCYMRILHELEIISKRRSELKFDIILVAFVNVDRTMELKNFTRIYNFFDEVMIYKDSRKTFNLKDTTIAILIDINFQILDHYGGTEVNIFNNLQKGSK